MSKIGTFDWIVSGTDVVEVLRRSVDEFPEQTQHICVLGSGTSTLSEDIQIYTRTHKNAMVVSVDNDEECLVHMAQRCSSNTQLKWQYCDLTELDSSAMQDLMQYGQSSLGPGSGTGMGTDVVGGVGVGVGVGGVVGIFGSSVGGSTGPFDVVVDKGTFDAILVEGSSFELLCNVHTLLRPGGVYALCSLHPADMLVPLLSTPSLGFRVQVETAGTGSSFSSMTGTVLLCTRMSPFPVNADAVCAEEKVLMDHYFQSTNPILTLEQEDNLRKRFLEINQPYIEVRQMHSILFPENESLGYSFDLFLEDLDDFSLIQEGYMNIDEAITFLKTKA